MGRVPAQGRPVACSQSRLTVSWDLLGLDSRESWTMNFRVLRWTALAFAIGLPTLLGAADFRRGDSNDDGAVDISDAVHLLGFLFLGQSSTLPCKEASDSNDDGEVDLSDAIFSLSFLFTRGAPLPPPGLECGQD